MRNIKKSWFRFLVIAVCLLVACLAACSRDPNVRKQKYLESGQRYFDKGQYREAAIQFGNAIQVDPRFAEAHYKMALTDLRLQQGPGALQELTTTIQVNPDHYAARLELAKLLVLSHQYAAAKEQLDVLTQNQPSNPEVYLILADYQTGANQDTTAALAALRKAQQLAPNNPAAYLTLGLFQAQGQQWSDAEVNLKKAADLSPKSTDQAMLALGAFYQTRGRFPEAEQTYRQAIQNVPSDPNPRLALAGLLMAENRTTDAETFMRQSKNDFPDNSVGYTMLGNFYISTNQTDKALTEYASLYKDHSKDPVVKKNYIQLLILKNSLDEAKKLNNEVLKVQPSDLDAQIYKAEIQLRQAKPADAVDTLQNVLKSDPGSAVAHYQLGVALDLMGNLPRAEAEWREAVRLNPDNVDAHRALASAAFQRSDVSVLSQEADQIIRLQPAAPDGYLLRGIAEISRKRYDMANDYIKRSLEKEPNNPAAYVQLGNLRLALAQMAEAQKAYQQALDQDPNSSDALAGLLSVALAQNQRDTALALVKAQLAKYPNNSAFHTLLGDLLKDQYKDLPGAEAEYKRAVELNKNNGPALVKLGQVQNARGAPDAALRTYLDGAKNNPRDVGFYLLAGSVYDNKKDWDNAKQMYQKALAIQPDNPLASNNLAYVMLEQGGNVDVAFQMAQTARRLLPSSPDSADTLGWAFYQKHVYTSAITLLREAVNKEPENALFNYHLGLAYAKSGQAGLARQQLDRVVRLKGDSSQAEDLRRAVAEIKEKS